MITLKDYQARVLDSLRAFFRQCAREGRPEAAVICFVLMPERRSQPP